MTGLRRLVHLSGRRHKMTMVEAVELMKATESYSLQGRTMKALGAAAKANRAVRACGCDSRDWHPYVRSVLIQIGLRYESLRPT